MPQPKGSNRSNAGPIGEVGDYRNDPNAQTDPLRNPDGIYSGPSKRNAIRDGVFAEVSNMPTGETTIHLGRRKKG